MADETRTGSGRIGTTAGGRTAEGEERIEAPPERVWRALTEAAELERWFPLEARVEPGVGGSIRMSWKNEFAGEMEILAWDPPRRLRTSWAFGSEPGEAQVTDYRLEGDGGDTVLRVVTSGFPEDAEWDEWVEGTRRGWRFELRSLKHYLEEHPGRDREVVYLRRRVPLGAAAAWERLFGPGGFEPRPLGGRPFDRTPPVQYAAVVDDPPGGLLRFSVEPSHAGDGTRDVTLWLSAWGAHGPRLEEVRHAWAEALDRLFPEGETP